MGELLRSNPCQKPKENQHKAGNPYQQQQQDALYGKARIGKRPFSSWQPGLC